LILGHVGTFCESLAFHETMHEWPGMGWGGVGVFIFALAIIALIILLIDKQNSESTDSKKYLEILKERYAKGEISKEEFEDKKKELT